MKTITKLDRGAVQSFLEKFGTAIGKGDSETIAKCFELPAIFVSDDAVMTLNTKAELEQMFQQGRKFYIDKGLVETRPEIEAFEALTDRIYEATVRWPGFDSDGREKWTERSHYVIRLDDAGEPKLRVALTLGGKEI